jgi:hypothetical protein
VKGKHQLGALPLAGPAHLAATCALPTSTTATVEILSNVQDQPQSIRLATCLDRSVAASGAIAWMVSPCPPWRKRLALAEPLPPAERLALDEPPRRSQGRGEIWASGKTIGAGAGSPPPLGPGSPRRPNLAGAGSWTPLDWVWRGCAIVEPGAGPPQGLSATGWATAMVEMSGLKRAFMGLRAAIGNFKVSAAPAVASGYDQNLIACYGGFGENSGPSANRDANGKNAQYSGQSQTEGRTGQIDANAEESGSATHHVYRAPNAPRTPFRFSFSAAPTANS